MTRYGVVGVGSIATAIVVGLCEGASAPVVVLSPRSASRSSALAERFPSVSVAHDNQGVVDASDVVIVSVLPDQADEVLSELEFRPGQAVVSAMAGVDLAALRCLVTPAAEIARSIPVPAVAGRASVTPVHPGTPSSVELYDKLGGTMVVDDERAYESLSVASATVAAYFDYLRAVSDWLEASGVPASEARRYVANHFAALAPELSADDVEFASLAVAHSTQGGLNEQFARHMRAAGTSDAVRDGLDALLARITGE